MLYISSIGRYGPITGRKIILVALLTCNGTFYRPLSVQVPFRSVTFIFFTMDTADMFSITFLQNDAKDNFVNAHNGLALLEFGPFSIFFLKFFKTCPTQYTVHVYLPWVFCEIAFGCENSFVLILWVIGTDVTEKDTKNMVWYNYKNLGYHNNFHI